MGSKSAEKPHALCIPYPAQGHINPMMHLAKLLLARGFYITFVNTEFNHERVTSSAGAIELKHLEDFNLESITDGLPPDDCRTQESLFDATTKYFLSPFKDLVSKLNGSMEVPRVPCIISDGLRNFTQQVVEENGIPRISLWTTSTCGYWGFLQYPEIIERGILPFKVVDWIPGMPNISLRDLPSFIRTTILSDIVQQFCKVKCRDALKASALILNTFEDLEKPVLDAMRERISCPFYTIGPVVSFSQSESNVHLNSVSRSLWKEEDACIEWLNDKEPKSVLYVNCGRLAILTPNQNNEFAWVLANSQRPFIWVIRDDLHVCNELGIGMEINNDVKREDVEELLRELMGGEKGKEMQLKAKKWMESSKTALQFGAYFRARTQCGSGVAAPAATMEETSCELWVLCLLYKYREKMK
ncbi:UDP-glycosyltransferase 85A1-like [Amborella trichopoda]|uniref:UDP-glycosyltransferase 85A1-like n=1 Tax=Amborella trichopoda TaxID=13333 RepID=UPI0009C1722D|nr:UDP-glycosyltransferase 85A1-like [Amborella trichopoda]|eukprot:XP_020528274.1 UDP-glycosyltransferase 85A1-like [Amborella trichopoda]